MNEYVSPTAIIDSNHPRIIAYARQTAEGAGGQPERAVRLYLAVRDGVRYDAYSPFHLPDHYRASAVLRRGKSFCVPKAALLCALARACNIPARVGFATVRNHQATQQMIDFLGSDVFVYHGFVELYLDGRWVKATPTFNKELCARQGVAALEFNGREDALLPAYDLESRRYMEYLEYHGACADIPVATIVAAWKEAYGAERVAHWIELFAEQDTPATAEPNR
jgi:transglutaminase-like putative cysteine protease